MSTPFILPALTEAGRNDVAYKILETVGGIRPDGTEEHVKAGVYNYIG